MRTNANGRTDAPPAAKGDIALSLETTVVSARVRAGTTLASVLRAHDVAVSDVAAIVAQAGSVFDLRKVRANQPYRLETTHTGTVRGFEYEIDGDRFLRVGRSPDDALVARVLPIPKTRSVEVVTGQIDREHSSLVAALDAAGETIDLTLALADIFGGEIDFTTEVQPGDHFELTVEKQYRDDHQFAGYGPILAAEFTNAGRRAFRARRRLSERGARGRVPRWSLGLRARLHARVSRRPTPRRLSGAGRMGTCASNGDRAIVRASGGAVRRRAVHAVSLRRDTSDYR